MPRPRQYRERVSTAIRFPLELHTRLQREADARMISINRIVIDAVEEWLQRHKPLKR